MGGGEQGLNLRYLGAWKYKVVKILRISQGLSKTNCESGGREQTPTFLQPDYFTWESLSPSPSPHLEQNYDWCLQINWATTWQNQQNDLCAQRRLRSAAQWVAKDSKALSRENWRLIRLDLFWANAQADLSLRWAHRSFCWFCHAAAQCCLKAVCISDIFIPSHSTLCLEMLLLLIYRNMYL